MCNVGSKRPRRSRFWIAAAALGGIAACGPAQPIVRPVGPSSVDGQLTLTPIIFATDDYYFRPRTVDATEGILEVPENRSDPTGRTTTIRFVRFASTSANPGPPIVYLAGGPGGSGIYSAAGDRFGLFMKLREVADVIALDQRGTSVGGFRPMCPGTWSYPLDRPLDPQTLEDVLRPFLSACAIHWADSMDVSAYNTRESADDLDDLRRALGVEKISLWGISYGTHLGLAYLSRHPERVHRAILAGVEGPDDTYKLPGRIDRVVLRVDSAVRADARAARLVADYAGSLRATLERLAAHPAITIQHPATGDTVTVVLGPLDLQRAVYFSISERATIENSHLVRLAPIFAGQLDDLARFAIQTRSGNTELVMALTADCASGASARRLEAIRDEESGTLLGDIANLDLRARCAGWSYVDLGDGFRAVPRLDSSVLFISGTLDPRTPPDNAESLLRSFPRAHHLVIQGGAHDDDLFLASPRIADAMVRFLETGDPGESTIDLGPLRFRLP